MRAIAYMLSRAKKLLLSKLPGVTCRQSRSRQSDYSVLYTDFNEHNYKFQHIAVSLSFTDIQHPLQDADRESCDARCAVIGRDRCNVLVIFKTPIALVPAFQAHHYDRLPNAYTPSTVVDIICITLSGRSQYPLTGLRPATTTVKRTSSEQCNGPV